MNALAAPLRLPCGVTVKNRILKSAMSEVLGTPAHGPSPGLATLYGRWARGGLGVAVTGNVMIDGRALGEPGNVVVEDDRDLDALKAWAKAGTAEGCQLWMQLNHPGKQAPRFLNTETVAPSAVGFGKELAGAFPVPRALTEAEIEALIERFAKTAAVAVQAGFSGVQVHGAHGYLVSQFLSPRHNERTDGWGGSLENRARFAREVLAAVRAAVGPAVPVAIKMNSTDFQKGGFSEDDALQVMSWFEAAGVDLIEVSGGTYEAPAMAGMVRRESSSVVRRTVPANSATCSAPNGPSDGPRGPRSNSAREGYFLDFVKRAQERVAAPLCVTGGFRTPAGMAQALEDGASMVGLARMLCVQPDFPAQVLAGEEVESLVRRQSTGVRAVDRVATLEVTWYENQIARLAAGQEPAPELSPWRSLATTVTHMGWQAFRMRRAK